MPESRLAKTRRSLPEGYQFGDARPDIRSSNGPCDFYRPRNQARFLVDGFPVCESCSHMRHVHMCGDFKQTRYPVPSTYVRPDSRSGVYSGQGDEA